MKNARTLIHNLPLRSPYAYGLVALMVLAGVAVVWRIFAAGLAASYLLPDAALTTGAAITANSSAIGGRMVQFGSVATPTPAPTATPTPTPGPAPRPTPFPAATKPGATNTGILPGTTLATVTGDQTYGPGANGTTVSNKNFKGFVTVTGANITFSNCKFEGRSAGGSNRALLDTEDSTGTITVLDSEFVPSNPSATIDGLWTRNTNIYRANIHGSVDGIKADSNTLIQDSYVHSMSWFASDPNQGGGPTHNDGVQSFAHESNVTIRHNNIDISMVTDGNAALQSSASNTHLESNWLDGGGCTVNFAAQPLGGATLGGIYITGNRFGRHQSFTGCAVLISLKTVLSQNSGNVWDDTGGAIPAPQQHD